MASSAFFIPSKCFVFNLFQNGDVCALSKLPELPVRSARKVAIVVTKSSKATIYATLVLAMCIASADVRGQSASAIQVKTATAEVPFQVVALGTPYPAGTYSVSTIGPTHLFIQDRMHKGTELFTVPDAGFSIEGKAPRLVFVERQGKNYLLGMVTANGFERVSVLYGATRKKGDVLKEVALNYQ